MSVVGTPRLEQRPEGLSLISGELVLTGDFSQLVPRIRQDRLAHELLVKAARIKGTPDIHVVDACAGLGEDGFLLAAAGFRVSLFERDELIAGLLEDAIARAKEDPSTAQAAARMTLLKQDSIQGIKDFEGPIDVVYLDPMFPSKRKSALTNKKLQIFQMLETPCTDARELFEAAKSVHPQKIVVKRPLKGECLTSDKPSYSLKGKVVRYDCYR